MPHHLVPGVEVDYAGQCWRVDRALGPDAVLLRNVAGETISAEPARIDLYVRTRGLPDYSETARTLTWKLIEGNREPIEESTRQGVQSADQKR